VTPPYRFPKAQLTRDLVKVRTPFSARKAFCALTLSHPRFSFRPLSSTGCNKILRVRGGRCRGRVVCFTGPLEEDIPPSTPSLSTAALSFFTFTPQPSWFRIPTPQSPHARAFGIVACRGTSHRKGVHMFALPPACHDAVSATTRTHLAHSHPERRVETPTSPLLLRFV